MDGSIRWTVLAALVLALPAFSAAQDDDAAPQRGLQTNTAEASPGYMLFNPNRSLTTYLVDVEGQVVHTWEHDLEPGRILVRKF